MCIGTSKKENIIFDQKHVIANVKLILYFYMNDQNTFRLENMKIDVPIVMKAFQFVPKGCIEVFCQVHLWLWKHN